MKWKLVTLAAVLFMAGAGFGIGYAQGQQSSAPAEATANDVPAYHATPPTGPLPDTLDPNQFPDARTRNIYRLAAKVKPVLYQQPCYCHCDREVGHTSLLDCFADRHGSFCDVCKKEAAYTYQQTKLGKTPGQIRAEIMAGKWKSVDLTKYDAAPTAPHSSSPKAAPAGGK